MISGNRLLIQIVGVLVFEPVKSNVGGASSVIVPVIVAGIKHSIPGVVVTVYVKLVVTVVLFTPLLNSGLPEMVIFLVTLSYVAVKVPALMPLGIVKVAPLADPPTRYCNEDSEVALQIICASEPVAELKEILGKGSILIKPVAV